MSTRNPLEWTEIGETVRSAQDVLCRIQLGKEWREHREKQRKRAETMLRTVKYEHGLPYDEPIQYPKSLGELCLELGKPQVKHWRHKYGLGTIDYQAMYPKKVYLSLKRVMYRRNTDPAKVSRATKADKIAHYFWKEQQEHLGYVYVKSRGETRK